MNGAHWHLVVNHLPIIFPVVGVIVMITGFISKSEAVKRTAFMIFVLGTLSVIAAMNTGESAEEVVENINGVAENFIESHEKAAETFAVFSYILGGISILGLWASFKQKAFSYIISIGIIVLAFVVLFFAKQTGTTGGEIRHTEIRSGNISPASEIYNTENDEDD
jgi:uncharacterized membrane protein